MEPMQRVSQYPGGEVGVTPGETPPGVDTMYLYHSNTLIFALYQEPITRSEHLTYLLLELSFLQTELFLERLSRQANNAFVY